MCSNFSDSHKISLKIIEAIKQHPILYIPEVKGNAIKLQEFRQKVWKRIADELNLDSSWVKLKWKNLRDTYCRILKYKNKSSKTLRRKKWIFEEHLKFLKFPYESNYEAQYVELTEEYINDINTEIIDSQDLLKQLDDNDEDDYIEYLEVLEEDIRIQNNDIKESAIEQQENNNVNILSETNGNNTLHQLIIDAYAKQIQSKFRKIRPKELKLKESNNSNEMSVFIKTPSVMSSNKSVISQNIQNDQDSKHNYKFSCQNRAFDSNDNVDQFFKSIAKTVKKLPTKVQADVKMDICKIIIEAEINHCKESSVENLHKYTNLPGMVPKLVLVPCRMLDNQNSETVEF